MLTYGLYTRKSDDDPKRTAKSIGEQLSECERLAARDHLYVKRVWQESRSAKTPGRRIHFKEMIRAIERGEINAILCWHVNRLARNMEEGGALVQLLIDGKLKEVRTPHSSYRTEENILPIVVEAASAAQYSLDLRRDVKRSMDSKFRDGGCNYRALPGYVNSRDPHNLRRRTIECDGKRFTQIRRFWDLILSDAYSVQAALRVLNDELGFRRRPTANLPAAPISVPSAYKLLRNPFYAGYVRQRGELIRGRHKPMVTQVEFDQVQKILNRRGFSIKRKHEHVYNGLIRCGYCGQLATGEFKVLSNGSIWETYHCSDSYRRCTRRGLDLFPLN